MCSVEWKEEVYPSRLWEAKLELLSLHSGENLASVPIVQASQRLQKSWPAAKQNGQRPNGRLPESAAPLLLKKTVARPPRSMSGISRSGLAGV
jgi:hypothetical protein